MGRQDPAARRVSNLTNSQVERKRAIDRANQQHCQRRKKARLQWLEQEVVRLSDTLEEAEAKIQQYETKGCLCAFTAGPTTSTTGLLVNNNNSNNNSKPSAGAVPNIDDVGVDPSRSDAIWSVNLSELLDPGHDDELGNIVFDYPMSLPGDDDDDDDGDDDGTTPSPLVSSQLGGGGRRRDTTTIPDWQIVPLHLPPENDLDRFIIDTTSSGRRLQQQTGGAGELSQAEFPSISSLLNPNLGDDGSKPLTFALATHVVRKSTVKSVTTRIALMYILSHLLRWLVCRNKQSYEKLPDYLKPTHLQRTVPHPAWVDVITWPQARDTIIRNKSWEALDFDEFRRRTGICMSVNWPYTDSGAFLDLGDGQNLVLSPIFENHIRRAENWTLSKSTAKDYPFMKAFCVALDDEAL